MGNQGGKALKWLPVHFKFERKNAPKSKRERPSIFGDWPPCPPIQHDGGRRSRPGVNPFISVLTVARCPAIFPGMWPHFGTLCPQVEAWGEGRGLSYACRRSLETARLFFSFPFAKIQPVFLTEQTGCIKHRTPFPPSATPAGITHYTLQAKSCAKGAPFGNPGQQNRRYAALSGSIPPFVVSSPFHGLFSPFVKFGVGWIGGRVLLDGVHLF